MISLCRFCRFGVTHDATEVPSHEFHKEKQAAGVVLRVKTKASVVVRRSFPLRLATNRAIRLAAIYNFHVVLIRSPMRSTAVQQQLLKALTPEAALHQWCDPAAVKAMDDLSAYAEQMPRVYGEKPTHYEAMHDRYWQIRGPLEDRVIGNLKNGGWRATALELPITLLSERVRVSARFWGFLTLDFKAATAEGNGLKLVEIEIEAAPSRQTEHLGGRSIDAPAPQRPESQPPIDISAPLHLSDDNAILTLWGEKLMFRGPIQKSILRQLVDAHCDDRRLRTVEILQKAGSEVDSIAKAFRSNRHLPKLKRIIRQEQGFAWLDLTTPP
jgi:hypothetical protein